MDKRISIMEVVLLIVILYLLGSTGYFHYRLAVDNYVRSQEKWKEELTQFLNYNHSIGVLKVQGTPQPAPGGPKK
jgi:hypothetical protein